MEVLVALTLLGLISVMLFSSFRFGVRAWEAGGARAEQLGQVEVVQTLIRNELSEASLLRLKSSGPIQESTFAGSPDELRFSGPMSAQFGMGGTYVFILSVGGTAGDRSLVLRWQPYRPDMPVGEKGWSDPIALLTGISEMELAYFGATEEEDRPTWRDFWKDQAVLPRLVRLHLTFQHDDPRWWPDLIVAPRTQQIGGAE